jgi:putative phosphoesterase
MKIGLISDTHGMIRDEALRALTGVELILHAGDVGGKEAINAVIDALAAIAPVQAVFGNTDPLDGGLPAAIDCEVLGVSLHVSHGHETGVPTPEKLVARYSADVIVYGHTHKALVRTVKKGSKDALVVNPGAAGPRRFDLEPSVAVLDLPAREARIIWL